MERTLAGYDLRRLDGDPTYAPGLTWVRETPWWRPTKADVKNGYPIKGVNLSWVDEDVLSAKCRALTRELLQWRAGTEKVRPASWGWIIALYLTDELSPFWETKENTQASYREVLGRWQEGIGGALIENTNFETLKRWKRAMEQNGRSVAYIHRMFTHLRMVARYGLAVKPALFAEVTSVMSSGALKVRAPKPRTVAPTPDQIEAIIAAAEETPGFALGLSLQWWLALRAVDVRGQWLGPKGKQRWADGLTWDMIDLDALTIRKMVSKTERHDAMPMIWDISPLPDLVDRLRAVPVSRRVGPVVCSKAGKPFTVRHYRDLWEKYRAAAGVPPEVKLMDTRAGAINDAMAHGASRLQLQHAANHKDGATTERYIRAREAGANNVIRLRAGA